MRRRRHAPVRFATCIVAAVLLYLAVFAAVMVAVHCTIGTTPDTLIMAVFGVAGTELLALAGKRIFERPKKAAESEDYQ